MISWNRLPRCSMSTRTLAAHVRQPNQSSLACRPAALKVLTGLVRGCTVGLQTLCKPVLWCKPCPAIPAPHHCMQHHCRWGRGGRQAAPVRLAEAPAGLIVEVEDGHDGAALLLALLALLLLPGRHFWRPTRGSQAGWIRKAPARNLRGKAHPDMSGQWQLLLCSIRSL